MNEYTKSEALSFFDATSLPLPVGQEALMDVFVDEALNLKLLRKQAGEINVGSVAPIQPISVDEAIFTDGVLALRMADGSIIPLGSIDREDVYTLPELTGVGLRQSDGTFDLPTTSVPGVSVEEEANGFRISALGLSGARNIKRLTAAIRNDYSAVAGGSIAVNTNAVINQWYPIPALNFLDDPQGIGASLVDGKLVLPPGTYYAEWYHAAYRTSVTASRFWSETHNNEILQGVSLYCLNNADGSVLLFHNSGYFRITETTTIQMQMQITVLVSATALWSAHNDVMGRVKDLFRIELQQVPDPTNAIPEVKRIREVTRRITANVDGNITTAANSEIAGYGAWRVLDSDTLTDVFKWVSVAGAAPSLAVPHWISIAFNDGPKRVTRYVMTIPATASSIYGPKDWEFQARNADTDEWVTLDTVVNWALTVAGTSCLRDLPAAVEYSQYRLLITGRNSGTTNGVQIGEFRLYEEY